MVEGITWTKQYQKTIFDDTIRVLSGIERDGQQNYGNLKRYFPPSTSTDRRKNLLLILDEIEFVESKKLGQGTLYDITDTGKVYLYEENEIDRNNIFHSSLYKNVIHYSYAFDFILENDKYTFTKEEIIEDLVLSSSNNFGTRIYDWKSAEYILNFMTDLKVVFKLKNEYEVNDEYKRLFNVEKFMALIIESLKRDELQFTKSLCEHLLLNSDKFMISTEPVNIDIIYKKLLNLNEIKDFLKFIPGLPRPPIPNRHTLTELKGGI